MKDQLFEDGALLFFFKLACALLRGLGSIMSSKPGVFAAVHVGVPNVVVALGCALGVCSVHPRAGVPCLLSDVMRLS